MKHAIILALLLVAGCKMADVENSASDAEKARHEMRQAAYEARRDSLKAASARAAAHADSATDLPEIPESSHAAKVAAVMQANDITLPQVVAFLYTYGFDVVSRSNTLRPHWSPAPPGRDAQGNIVPVAYYVANIRIAAAAPSQRRTGSQPPAGSPTPSRATRWRCPC